MTNKELAAKCLIEAAGLLNDASVLTEAEARDTRKELIKDSKNIKNQEAFKKFSSGKLDKAEADKIYKEVRGELETLLERAVKIPKETAGEKVWGYFRSTFTLRGYGLYFVAGLLGNSIAIPAAAGNAGVAMVGNIINTLLGVGAYTANSKVDTDNGTEYNWNKSHAIVRIKRVIAKLDKMYDKHYKNKTTNESVDLDALLDEAVGLLVD